MPEVEHVKSDQVLPNEILVIIVKRGAGFIEDTHGLTILNKKITQFAPSADEVKIIDRMVRGHTYAYINEENL